MADNPRLLTRICIAGGGSAGWMTAAALSAALGHRCRIELVESEEIGIVGVGEATIPPIKLFNQQIGVDEAAFLRATHGTIKLAIAFVGWGDTHSRYPHPFGAYGAAFDRAPVFQHWLAAHLAGAPEPLEDYSFAWALARAGRFSPLAEDPRRIQSTHDYAYHFDAMLYGRFLRSVCEPRGVVRTEGRIEVVERNGESGDVTALILADGRRVEADFFVDCTGFRGLLIEEALGTGYEDWRYLLPCDRAVALPTARTEPPSPYTRATVHAAGWQWRIPLQHRTGNGLVYASDHLSDDAAAAALLAAVEGQPLAEPRFLRFTTGRRRQAWNRNVVAIGLAAGFLEPLESTSLHLIQTGVTRLLALLPERGPDPLAQAEYNRITAEEYERIRDFLVLHYHANRRPEPFWQARAQTPPPERLQWKLDHFRQFGRVVSEGPELFANTAWTAVMIGQGVLPQSPEPLVRLRGDEDARRILPSLRRTIADTVAQCPEHLTWLEHIGALSARA